MPSVITPQSRCLLGLAKGDITPPVGIYHRMWGAATHDRSTGIHQPLTATAVVMAPLEGTDPGQVLIAVDHCLLWAREMDRLLEALAVGTGLPQNRILVVFSHTHAAGLMGQERLGLPGGEAIPKYLESLSERLVELVRQAQAARGPATLVYGTGRCSMAAQRDFWDQERGEYVCGFHPEGFADDTVVVARAVDDRGQTLATFVNYACHPTTLAWQNTLISPDFPGALRTLVEDKTGAPCVFLQGASGDLGPREGFVGDVTVAERNGRQLGYAALAVLEGMPPAGTVFTYKGAVVSGATIGTWAHEPFSAKERAATATWDRRQWTVDLPYRSGLLTSEANRAERQRWLEEEEAARGRGDAQAQRHARAMGERATRWQGRLAVLPPGPAFPLPVTLWRIGGALWVAVEAEHYQNLQVDLRNRFPGVPIMVMTLANGSRATYLPARDAYGKGIYQETIAVLEAGCLERLTEEIARTIANSLPTD